MSEQKRLRVGVLFGGRSAEHEISILSARNVIAALDPERFEAIPIGITRDGRWIQQSTRRLLHERGDPRFVQLSSEGPEVSLLQGRREELASTRSLRNQPLLDVIFP